MIQFKKVKKVLNIGIILDESSSMQPFKKEAIDSLNAQVASFKEEAKKSGIETKLTISTFANEVRPPLVIRAPINDVQEIDPESYHPCGMTALYDAMNDMMFKIASEGDMSLLLVITDGEENNSRCRNTVLKEKIFQKLKTDLWTFAVCVPKGCKSNLVRSLGIPDGCVTEWETSVAGIEKLTNVVRSSNTMLFKSYLSGNTRSSNYFSPDLDLKVKDLKKELTDVTNKFHIWDVKIHPRASKSELVISNYVNERAVNYTAGMAFYELTKKEKVQDYKDIVIMNKDSGRLFSGDGVRDVLNIPEGSISLHPSFNPKFTVFIRSMSWNRKLVEGTKLLILKP